MHIENTMPQARLRLVVRVVVVVVRVVRVVVNMRQSAQSYLGYEHAGIRRAAAECIAMLCNIQGEQYTNSIISAITASLQSPESSDPNTRAGGAFLLGCIHRVAGSRTQAHVPMTVSVLHVLAKDQSPVTQVWALHGMWLTIETVGLAFAPFANPTLSLMHSLLLSKVCSTVGSYQCLGRVTNSTIAVLGPELDEAGQILRRCKSIANHVCQTVSVVLMIVRNDCVCVCVCGV
jgi:hypothetical protein